LAEPILDDVCMPPYMGPKEHDDLHALLTVVQESQPKVVVEFGTGYGNLGANILRQCPSARLYTVNAVREEQTGDIVTYSLAREDIGRVYRAHGFRDRVVQIYTNTLDLDLDGYIQPKTVDLAIIDACHDLEYVISDFLKLMPFMREGGMVLLHDTHPSMEGHLAGSYMACMLLRLEGYRIEHIERTWWALWRA
jgi:predicted O-methyltransferase YrrM